MGTGPDTAESNRSSLVFGSENALPFGSSLERQMGFEPTTFGLGSH